MKKKLIFSAALVSLLALGLVMTGCNTGGGGGGGVGPIVDPAAAGKLTVNNYPSGNVAAAVNVYKDTTITSLSQFNSYIPVVGNIVATTPLLPGIDNLKSPFSLYSMPTATSGFTASGKYMIIVNYTGPEGMTSKYKTGLTFTNGSATVDWNTLSVLDALPLN